MRLRSRRLRRRHPLRACRALAVLGAVGLAGCSTVSSLNPFSSGPGAASAACPTAAILHPLAQTAVFAPGAKPQPMGVAFYGVLDDVRVKCDRTGDALQASLDIVVIGERGPAAGAATGVDLQYFVAATGPNQSILSKRSLPVHIAVPADAKRAGVTDHIEEAIPLAGNPPGAVNIVLGFQQSPEIIDFYRHFRGR